MNTTSKLLEKLFGQGKNAFHNMKKLGVKSYAVDNNGQARLFMLNGKTVFANTVNGELKRN